MSTLQGVSFLIGVVLGVGIFKAPQLVAANVETSWGFLGLWLLGGLIALIGALCYAELGAARPDSGGEYRFLSDAYGLRLGVLFAWARGTVIQTGAIAAVAFVFGGYATELLSLGAHSTAIYAALVIIVLTAVNLTGTRAASWFQQGFTLLEIAALGAIVLAGLLIAPSPAEQVPAAAAAPSGSGGAIGLAMVFILLTYGGWNEAAYLAGELRKPARNMVRVLVFGTAAVTVIYLLVNLAYLNFFGLEGIRANDTVGAALINQIAGPAGGAVLALVVCAASITTLNATIFTGARAYSALGQDVPMLRGLGLWDPRGDNPANAVLAQGAIALLLVAFGAISRDGFAAMVEYSSPVFWFFLLLVGISVFIFRARPGERRPFSVPLYPLTPILFCASCAYMLYSSLMYTGMGAIIGVIVLLLGTPLVMLARRPAAVTAPPSSDPRDAASMAQRPEARPAE